MKFSTRELCQIGVFVVVSAVLAQIVFPLPFSPVQLSLGLLGTFVAGIFLRPQCALFSQICYLALGGIGLPIFGYFKGGPGVLFGPTGGYLLAYPFMALIVALSVAACERRGAPKRLLFASALGSLSLALLLCYTLGTAWLMFLTKLPLQKALALAVYPFIPLDALKIAFAAFALLPLRGRVLKKADLQNA